MANVDKDIQEEIETGEELSFWDHLEELRWSLMRIVGVLLVCVIGTFIAMPHIFDPFILGPTRGDFFLYEWFAMLGKASIFKPDFHVDIININVASQFMTHISTSLWMGLVITFPYFIYEIWKFIRPALFPEELKNIRTAFLSGTFMFFLGCTVGYCLVFPFTFRFLTEYQISPEITNQINLGSYINNFIMMIFVMGLVFEMPLLAWVLSKLGLITKEFLREYKKHAIVVLLVLAAVITPSGDPFTLSVVFLPLYLLYELSIKVVQSAPVEDEEVEEDTEEM
jgi:sec-independent protein translocase protein TatC